MGSQDEKIKLEITEARIHLKRVLVEAGSVEEALAAFKADPDDFPVIEEKYAGPGFISYRQIGVMEQRRADHQAGVCLCNSRYTCEGGRP